VLVTTIRLPLDQASEWQHLTPLSDLHIDSRDCDHDALAKLIRERNALRNHRYILLGDVGDWIVPSDRKRHQPSNAVDEIASADDVIGATTDWIISKLSAAKHIDLIATGNHEAALLSHCHYDATTAVCRGLKGPQPGGFCGFLRYRFGESTTARQGLTVLYHHGAWAGMQSLPPGAVRWATQECEGWDVFAFGHNHRLAVDVKPAFRAPKIGRTAYARRRTIVACGTHLRTHCDRGAPSYSAVKGHGCAPVGAPLIRWRVARTPHTAAQDHVIDVEVIC
jgi:predicted phosphodiesterase